MDKDTLYYHFLNLALILTGLFSICSILNPIVFILIISGVIAGFFVSWRIKDQRIVHMDIFIGMLSLSAVLIIMGRLNFRDATFDNLLEIFSAALAWLALFQSFGLKSGKSYATIQFIAICLFIASVTLALQQESFYMVMLVVFLFTFIFTMRLDLVCEKKRKGSDIIGDQARIMGLWQQIKVASLMFSFVVIVASIVYPFVPRFENLSVRWLPSTLLGLPGQVPILKLLKHSPDAIKDDKRRKKEQIVNGRSKKRETDRKYELKKKQREEIKEAVERFPAKEINKNIDTFKIESLTVRVSKAEVPLDKQCSLEAELKMNDGTVFIATQLVDWKATGTGSIFIDNNGTIIPKKEGYVQVSAFYMGSFSNDINITITAPLGPIKKKTVLYYVFNTMMWLLLFGSLYILIWNFIKSKRLSELAVSKPREFIKEIYVTLCRALKLYGVPRLESMAYREYYESVKGIVYKEAEPMRLMTEGLLEARFSMHNISVEHSRAILDLFHKVKEAVLEREERKEFFKKILFRILILDVLMVRR